MCVSYTLQNISVIWGHHLWKDIEQDWVPILTVLSRKVSKNASTKQRQGMHLPRPVEPASKVRYPI
jgi:hypothetical protein